MTDVLYHFSEDATIERFTPHVPRTNPTEEPAVWAIDVEHAPLYWFPRDCPRVAAWPRNEAEAHVFRTALQTTAHRVQAIELEWLERMRTTVLHRYTFDAGAFTRWPKASGQWVSHRVVEPVDVAPVGDLLHTHVAAGVELRLVASLWPLHDLVVDGAWDFSIVRMANAAPRAVERRSIT